MKREPVLLLKMEGRYFVQSHQMTGQPPPPEVCEMAAYIQNRSSEISSYSAEITIASPHGIGKTLLYVDNINSRSRMESITYFEGTETVSITVTTNSTSYHCVPETGVAIRTVVQSQDDSWDFSPESEYMGMEEVDGEECLRIRDYVMGYEVDCWFSNQTGLMMKTFYASPGMNQSQTMTYTYMDIDSELDPELFSLPPNVEVRDKSIVGRPGTVLLAMPIVTEDQAPLFLSVETDPPGYLLDFKPRTGTGTNQVAEISLRPALNETVEIIYNAYVLVKPKDYSVIPKKTGILSESDFELWTRPQPSIQCSEAEISSTARSLVAQDDTIWGTAMNIMDFMWEVKGRGGVQDAVNVLKTKGAVCNGFATLSCALLRASGIPARVLAVIPVGMKVAMHYLVEFYVPDFGWVWLEPSFKKLPHQTTDDVVIGIMYPEDDLGSGGYEGIYASGELILTLVDPDTGRMGGLEAMEVARFQAGGAKAEEAYDMTLNLWREYESYDGWRSVEDKAEVRTLFQEGLSGLETQSISAYFELIESLRSEF